MNEESNIFSIKAQRTKYSKFGNALERLFKNNSLDYLQNKLKHPRYFKPKEEKIDDFSSRQKLNLDKLAMDLVNNNRNKVVKTDNYLSSTKNKDANFNLDSKINSLLTSNKKSKFNSISNLKITRKNKNRLKKDSDDESEPEKELTVKELLKKNREIRIQREKELKNEAPDMWKYNPNYNIRFKNSPRVILPPIQVRNIKQSSESYNNNITTEGNSNLLTNSHLITEIESINNDYMKHNYRNTTENRKHTFNDNNNQNNNNRKNSILDSPVRNSVRKGSIVSNSHAINTNNEDKNIPKEKSPSTPFHLKNRALKFDSYTSRKPIDIPITNNIPYMYTEPSQKNVIDFSKMSERGEKLEKFRSPGICYYQPKYDLVETKQTIIPFKVKTNKKDPRYRIQKLWRSYNVSKEYKTVNLK